MRNYPTIRVVAVSVFIGLSFMMLRGCAWPGTTHAYILSPDAYARASFGRQGDGRIVPEAAGRIASINVGDSRERVLEILGVPSLAVRTGGKRRYEVIDYCVYYLSAETGSNGMQEQLVVYFDSENRVTSVRSFGSE